MEHGRSKPQSVHSMFSAIAPRYDLLNRLISFGQDQRWRRALAQLAVAGANSRWARAPVPAPEGRQAGAPAATRDLGKATQQFCILDAACGTGDVVAALLETLTATGHSGAVTGVDFSAPMIELAKRKFSSHRGLTDRRIEVQFVQADAMALPYPNASFDACTIAFGLRNLPDMRRGVHELLRILRPGGALCILETGQPPPGLWRLLARLFASTIMPLIGFLVSGHWRAYRYLYSTSWRFPSGTGLAALVEAEPLAGRVDWRPLAGGVAYLYRIERCAAE